MRGYRSARELQQTVDVLLAAQVALLTLHVIGWAIVALGGPWALTQMIVRGARLSSPILALLFAGTAVAFLAWVHRAAANLPALGAGDGLRPGLAVALFFLPMGNVLAAPWVLHTLWVASETTPPPERRSRALVIGWAAALTLSIVFAAPLGRFGAHVTRGLAAWALLTAALRLGAGLACLAIARAVQRRQDAQWLDLEQRRAVPAPAADRLR